MSLTERYIAMAVQGDLRAARRMLEHTGSNRSAEYLDLDERFQQRFVQRSEPINPGTGTLLVDRAVAAYRDYWVRSLLGDRPETDQEIRLESALRPLLGIQEGGGSAEDTYRLLGDAVRALGFGALAVPAPPLQDLFIWGAQRDQDYTVALTDQTRVVTVAFMSDFVSLGWKDYAALGLATTTGWVEDGILYCVERAYIPGTERFEVSYLKHEVRHLADLERFPDLRSVELEYRAKLTELAFASQTLDDLLADFSAKSAPNPQSPHALANHRVLNDLHDTLFGQPLPEDRDPWRSVEPVRVNAAARGLLRRSTQTLEGIQANASP